jgi:hypothetical protein
MAFARGSYAECDQRALRRSGGELRVHLRSLPGEAAMTESTVRQTLPAQPRILFWDATAAHHHAVPAAGEVLSRRGGRHDVR